MRLADLAAAAGLACPMEANCVEIAEVSHDSREAAPGVLFVALAGSNHDGHDFLPEAFAKGAPAAVVQATRRAEFAGRFPDRVLLGAGDPRAHLARLARAVYGEAASMRLAAVTGTNGKTTTGRLIRAMYEARFGGPAAFLGTIGYDLGDETIHAPNTTPDPVLLYRTLARARAKGIGAAVLEASSHGLALGRIEGIDFDLAVFTNLSQDHLDFHRDMEDYFQAKRLLFTKHLRPAARAAVGVGDLYGARLAEELGEKAIAFSAMPSRAADLVAEDVRLSMEGTRFGIRFAPRVRGEAGTDRIEVETALLGATNVENALAAAAAGLALDLDAGAIRDVLAAARPVPGRFEVVPGEAPFRVVVDYAHTPDALARLIETARALRPRRVLLVFGAGGDRDRSKRAPMGAAASRADLLFVTSDNPRNEDPGRILDDVFAGIEPGVRARRIPDRRAAIREAIEEARPDDIVLIAGKGHEDYQIVRGEKRPFDDRKEAAAALAARFSAEETCA